MKKFVRIHKIVQFLKCSKIMCSNLQILLLLTCFVVLSTQNKNDSTVTSKKLLTSTSKLKREAALADGSEFFGLAESLKPKVHNRYSLNSGRPHSSSSYRSYDSLDGFRAGLDDSGLSKVETYIIKTEEGDDGRPSAVYKVFASDPSLVAASFSPDFHREMHKHVKSYKGSPTKVKYVHSSGSGNIHSKPADEDLRGFPSFDGHINHVKSTKVHSTSYPSKENKKGQMSSVVIPYQHTLKGSSLLYKNNLHPKIPTEIQNVKTEVHNVKTIPVQSFNVQAQTTPSHNCNHNRAQGYNYQQQNNQNIVHQAAAVNHNQPIQPQRFNGQSTNNGQVYNSNQINNAPVSHTLPNNNHINNNNNNGHAFNSNHNNNQINNGQVLNTNAINQQPKNVPASNVQSHNTPANNGGVFNSISGNNQANNVGSYNSIPSNNQGNNVGTFSSIPSNNQGNNAGAFNSNPANNQANNAGAFNSLPANNQANNGGAFNSIPSNNQANNAGPFNSIPANNQANNAGGFNSIPANNQANNAGTFNGINGINQGNNQGTFNAIHANNQANNAGTFNSNPANNQANNAGTFNGINGNNQANNQGTFNAIHANNQVNNAGTHNAIPANNQGNNVGTFNGIHGNNQANSGATSNSIHANNHANNGGTSNLVPGNNQASNGGSSNSVPGNNQINNRQVFNAASNYNQNGQSFNSAGNNFNNQENANISPNSNQVDKGLYNNPFNGNNQNSNNFNNNNFATVLPPQALTNVVQSTAQNNAQGNVKYFNVAVTSNDQVPPNHNQQQQTNFVNGPMTHNQEEGAKFLNGQRFNAPNPSQNGAGTLTMLSETNGPSYGYGGEHGDLSASLDALATSFGKVAGDAFVDSPNSYDYPTATITHEQHQSPSYAQGHKGLSHFQTAKYQHLNTDTIDSTKYSSDENFKPSHFLGAINESGPPTSSNYEYPDPSLITQKGSFSAPVFETESIYQAPNHRYL